MTLQEIGERLKNEFPGKRMLLNVSVYVRRNGRIVTEIELSDLSESGCTILGDTLDDCIQQSRRTMSRLEPSMDVAI